MLSLLLAGLAPSSFPCSSVAECQNTTMWHLPGPNPIISPGLAGWMSIECEIAGGVVKDGADYYCLYHCLSDTTGYQVGVSTAKSPLGPWSPPADAPVLAVSPGADTWDNQVVASMNVMPNPRPAGVADLWLGYYEGGMGNRSLADGKWSMGLATAPSPGGPWAKHARNPILSGAAVCDAAREFTGKDCAGMYIAAVMHGAHTGGEYWVYMEAPINENDEGPLALWAAAAPEGPFAFRAYVLDGGNKGGWDAGRYSESRVQFFNGLFHLFATASPNGNPSPSKYHENIGWAVSADGVHFLEHPANPLAPYSASTPHTVAMAEGHVHMEAGDDDLVYVYHTIRWDDDKDDAFAPRSRNGEDLGLELFSPRAAFSASLPIVTPNWKLALAAGEEAACAYDWANYRYCVNLKAVLGASGTNATLRPTLSFRVRATCATPGTTYAAAVVVYAFTYKGGVARKPLATLGAVGGCSADGVFEAETAAGVVLPGSDVWVVASPKNTGAGILTGVEVWANYNSSGVLGPPLTAAQREQGEPPKGRARTVRFGNRPTQAGQRRRELLV